MFVLENRLRARQSLEVYPWHVTAVKYGLHRPDGYACSARAPLTGSVVRNRRRMRQPRNMLRCKIFPWCSPNSHPRKNIFVIGKPYGGNLVVQRTIPTKTMGPSDGTPKYTECKRDTRRDRVIASLFSFFCNVLKRDRAIASLFSVFATCSSSVPVTVYS